MTQRRKIKVTEIGCLIILLLMIMFPGVTQAIDWNKGSSYNNGNDSMVYPQLHTSNGEAGDGSSNNSIKKNVRELKVGDVFWITGWGNANQSSRAPAILCSEHGTTMTAAQKAYKKRLQYKITKVSRITSYSNHTPASKGLAYITTIKRNNGKNFDIYEDALDEVQNAFWTYSVENITDIVDKDKILASPLGAKGEEGKDGEIKAVAEQYKQYVEGGIQTSASITNVSASWNSEYSSLYIKYTLNYKNVGEFGQISKVKIFYKDNNGKEREKEYDPQNGKNEKEITDTDFINNIPPAGCTFYISVDYTYTLVDATICKFEHVAGGTGRGQNLAIVSGERWTETKNTTVTGKIPNRVTSVSMQKYITKVIDKNGVENTYDARKNLYADDDSNLGVEINNKTYNHKNVNKISDTNNAIDFKKSKNVVNIEAGDTVEYTIEIYNNSNVVTKVEVVDRMIKDAAIERLKLDGIDIPIPTVKEKDNYYKEYELLGDLTLKAKEMKILKVLVNYGIYKIDYSNNPIVNKAWINSSFINVGEYRTIDADYVIMKKYQVSLEKWVSNVSKKNSSESSPKNNLIATKYPKIIEYLKDKVERENLISEMKRKSNNIEKEEYLKYIIKNGIINVDNYLIADINGDGGVNADDLNYYRVYEVFKSLGDNAKEIIDTYIKSDLDKDGKVTVDDFNIYKTLKANLYETGDQIINEKDRYIFMLKLINCFDQNGLNNLKLKRLNSTKEDIIAKIEEYIKSDVNNDGIVNKYDNYVLSEEKNQMIDKTIDETEILYNIHKCIENIEENNDATLDTNFKDYMNIYDFNNDRIINNEDIELLAEYNNSGENGKYELIKKFEKEHQEDILSLIEKDLTIESKDNKYNPKYDFSNDNIISLKDINFTENEKIIEEIIKILEFDNIEHDFTNDKKVSYDDYKLVSEYYTIKNKVQSISSEVKEKIIRKYNISEEDIFLHSTMQKIIKEYNVCFEDKILDETKLKGLKEKIEKEGPIESMLEGGWMNWDYTEYNDFDIDKNGEINQIDVNLAEGQIKNQKRLDEKDIYAIKLYKGMKLYNINNIDLENNKFYNLNLTYYDFNNDNLINIIDLNLLNELKEINNLDKYDELKEDSFIEFFEILLNDVDNNGNNKWQDYINSLNLDINNDGSVNDVDYNIIKENENSSSQNIIQNIELYREVLESKYTNYDSENGIIKYSEEQYYSYLDVNEDGTMSEEDKKYIETYFIHELLDENVDKDKIKDMIEKDITGDKIFNKEDFDIIKEIKEKQENYDLNDDEEYNQEDLDIFKELERMTDEDKIAILDYLKNGENDSLEQNCEDREGHAEYLTRTNNGLEDSTKKDEKWTRHNTDKYDNVVTVSESDYVTYTIKVTNNDEKTSVYISEIIDELPVEVKCLGLNGDSKFSRANENATILNFKNLSEILLDPGKEITFDVIVQVTEPNMSINLLKNTAKITQMKNKNGIEVQDSTPYNNEDSDYIQMRDIKIAGTVWNDLALDKKQDNYNGLYNGKDVENKLEGIKVQLYRVGTGVVATTKTDSEGNYSFSGNYIKASKEDSNNNYLKSDKYQRRWKEYYNYYVIFEYDGITYTSTPDGTTCIDITDSKAYKNGEYQTNSNAKEDNGPVKETRQHFNDRFSTINNLSEIEYTTKNENGYIPQSNHVYDEETMAMQSSTNLIQMQNKTELEEQLKYVNLGLRGRDIFDLELTSDVYSTKVTVNRQEGTYNYNNNRVTVKKSDIDVAKEDAANFASETREGTVGEIEQAVRNTDLDVSKTNSNYSSTGLGIEVTYKISVTNASQTVGTASKVINYYDSRYEFVKAYVGNQELNVETGTRGNGYNSVIITTPEIKLEQSQTMEIYVTYRLKEPTTTLSGLLSGAQTIPTYNMAEVYEYKTFATNNEATNNEATRGLLDKDSAPGSVGIEKVRLANGTSNETTVEYYFKAQNLSNLKYEDDTYATPTLYFTSSDSGRKITGTVFEDYTVIYDGDNNARIKSGNGIQDAATGEPGIKGVKVQLIENVNGGIIRYIATTDTKGEYTFENFLPGNYIIKYIYGDSDNTFIVTSPNMKSYNGEDFQATNNTGEVKGTTEKTYKLNGETNFWYAYNEKDKVSTATDNSERRQEVSKNVVGFNDLQMQVLNNARDGKKDATVTGVIDEKEKEVTITSGNIENLTNMYALTPNFNLKVEKIETDINNQNPTQKDAFSDYVVSNMNFGIAEVPVTTIDLQKTIDSFTIRDSADQNTIAKISKDKNSYSVSLNTTRITENKKPIIAKGLAYSLDGMTEEKAYNYINQNMDNVEVKTNITDLERMKLQEWMNKNSISEGIKITHGWKVEAGDVYAPAGTKKITAQIQDEKLQGAKLQITYEITASMYTEKNFDNTSTTVPSITGVIDYIDNDLSYNPELNKEGYWEITNYDDALKNYNEAKYACKIDEKEIMVVPNGTVDPDGTKYTTIVKAKEGNPLLLTDVGTSDPVNITLEKILSSGNSSILDIITSSIDTYEYDNIIEITGLDYTNTKTEIKDENGNVVIYRDRVRTPERYIILAGSQHDSFSAETLSIFPPTGENRSINYYILAITSIGILAVGIVLIKKFVINNKK